MAINYGELLVGVIIRDTCQHLFCYSTLAKRNGVRLQRANISICS